METKPSPSLVALKPRQVVLSSNRPTVKNMASARSLSPQQKSLLLLSVARFLESNSFSKTLKKFLSEAQILKNDLTGSSLDLEEMCCKYLAISDHSSSKLNREQFQDIPNDNLNNDEQGVVSAVSKMKKKKRDSENTINAKDGQTVVDNKSAKPKMSEEQVSQVAFVAPIDDSMGGLQLDESAKQQKEKKKKNKKSKVDSELHVDNAECPGGESKKFKDAVSMESNGLSDARIESKTKVKKKKKNKLTSDSLVDRVEQNGSEDKPQPTTTSNGCDISLEKKAKKSKEQKIKKDESEELEKGKSGRKESKDNINGISNDDSTIADGKVSKKRKRLDSEVHESLPVDENATEDSKRRKKENGNEQYTELKPLAGADKHANEDNNGESVDVGANNSHEQENGNSEKAGKNSEQKSSKKQQNSSAQSKKFFQRVKIDEVVFVDKRLEDNSYWAKSGAETGYGAKAQEVLGQVKGRDFRHEKTKKKRGSYRGGHIDLQSHSVKFNYSDEE